MGALVNLAWSVRVKARRILIADGTWLSIGEVVARYRAAGYPDHVQTIRREIDAAISAGEVEHYRTRGRFRRVRAADVDALIAVRRMEPGPDRDAELERLRRRNRGEPDQD